jgi:mono/diheme cytochrome c family protein
MEKIVNRKITGIAALVLVCGGPLLSTAADKKAASTAAAKRGQAIFEKRCVMCHYPDRTDKRVGPGLKGIYKRGTFVTNGKKVTDESLEAWIKNGDSMMPPFKDVLDAQQLNDIVAYLKTL